MTAAEDVVTEILGWRTRCPELLQERRNENLALTGMDLGETVFTSSAPWTHGRSDGSEGYWYTTSFEQSDGTRSSELLLVARVADRISLIALHETNPAGSLDAVDASELLNRSFERLG